MRRKFRWDLMLLFAVALAVRLIHYAALRDTPLFDVPKVDAKVFWDMARALAEEGETEAVFFKPPLFGWLLAGVMRLVGESVPAARLAVTLLGAAAAPLTAVLAGSLLGRRSALIAGAIVALQAPAVFYGSELLPATVVMILHLVALILLDRGEEQRGWKLTAAGGIVIGLSALARPTVLLLIPLLLWRYRTCRSHMAAVLSGSLLMIAPVTISNLLGGSAVLVSSNGGLNFYMGNHAGADGRSARAPQLPNDPFEAREAAVRIASAASGRELTANEVSNYWYRQGFSWWGAHPGDAVALGLRKIYFLLNDREIADNIDFYGVREISPVLRWLPLGFALLLAPAIPGFIRLRKRRTAKLLLLYGAAAALPVVLFFVVGRFRLPLVPLLAIGAVAGGEQIVRRLRSAPRTAVWPMLLVAIALLVSFSRAFGVGTDTSWHYHHHCADVLYRRGDIAGAVASYETSVERNDAIADTRNALGFLYAEQGRNLERAEELIRGAIRLDQVNRRYYLDSLGWVLFKQQKLEEAAAALEEAVPLFTAEDERPRAEALLHLGLVRQAQGRSEEAVRCLQDAAVVLPQAAAALEEIASEQWTGPRER